jgi:BirA family biotin operon repressor/biotin-[acetyl-CoA-carboxylase] ligase
MQLRSRLLGHLADGQFHSGESLGKATGVSRMAVCKHLKALRETGVELEVVRGKGYRLPAACELLDQAVILAGLRPATRAALGPVELHLALDSTSSHLRQLAAGGAPTGSVCMAELQLAGRGRQGREWVSPFGSNLYLSLLWRNELGAAALGGLSLVIGVAVLQSLHALGVAGARLKWPNDVLVDDAKLAGILIEVTGESAGPCAVVIGVGINVRMPAQAAAGIDQPWTDLASQPGACAVSRNRLATLLLDALFTALTGFESSDLEACLREWRRHDALYGRPVLVQVAGKPVRGIARGVDATGALLIEDSAGRQQRFVSGEVSVRAQ